MRGELASDLHRSKALYHTAPRNAANSDRRTETELHYSGTTPSLASSNETIVIRALEPHRQHCCHTNEIHAVVEACVRVGESKAQKHNDSSAKRYRRSNSQSRCGGMHACSSLTVSGARWPESSC